VGGRLRAAKLVVILAVCGAALFGGYLAYLAYTNDSFPAQERPFGDYAQVVSTSFNGTEVAFNVRWLSGDYLPLYTQVTSTSSDVANTPVCGLGLQKVAAGETLPMPFGISKPTAVLTNLELSIAVRTLASGQEFTIVYSVPSVSAQQGDLQPSGLSCAQPAAAT
jgi:hypothetical protein